jgi:hypothetical protein
VPAKKTFPELIPVSSCGAPGSRGPVEGVSVAERSGGGGGRIVIELLSSDVTVFDLRTLSGPVAAE